MSGRRLTVAIAALLLVCAAHPLVTEHEISLTAAKAAENLEKATGGFTYNLRRGSLAGANAYAVAVLPERSVVIRGQASASQIAEYLQNNLDVLRESQFSAGGWYDRASHQTYLDLSIVVRSRQMAIRLGRENNQKAVLYLRTLEEISTSGTGEVIQATSPLTTRRIHALARHVKFEDWRWRLRELRANR